LLSQNKKVVAHKSTTFLFLSLGEIRLKLCVHTSTFNR
jgi:hypothetical protein